MNILHRQLEEQRFAHALDYVVESAVGPKRLSTSELARLNSFLTDDEDPWRFEATSVRIPSGRTHHFNIVSNPVVTARDVIGDAQRLAGNGELLDGALHLYSQLVLQHVFKDANRRTAILATVWLVSEAHASMNAQELAGFAIGDLREADDLAALKARLKALIK